MIIAGKGMGYAQKVGIFLEYTTVRFLKRHKA